MDFAFVWPSLCNCSTASSRVCQEPLHCFGCHEAWRPFWIHGRTLPCWTDMDEPCIPTEPPCSQEPSRSQQTSLKLASQQHQSSMQITSVYISCTQFQVNFPIALYIYIYIIFCCSYVTHVCSLHDCSVHVSISIVT